jgi:hypothetical protein
MGETDRQWPSDDPKLGMALDPFAAVDYVSSWMRDRSPSPQDGEAGAARIEAEEWLNHEVARRMEARRRERQQACIRQWYIRGRAWLAMAGVVTPPYDYVDDQA